MGKKNKNKNKNNNNNNTPTKAPAEEVKDDAAAVVEETQEVVVEATATETSTTDAAAPSESVETQKEEDESPASPASQTDEKAAKVLEELDEESEDDSKAKSETTTADDTPKEAEKETIPEKESPEAKKKKEEPAATVDVQEDSDEDDDDEDESSEEEPPPPPKKEKKKKKKDAEGEKVKSPKKDKKKKKKPPTPPSSSSEDETDDDPSGDIALGSGTSHLAELLRSDNAVITVGFPERVGEKEVQNQKIGGHVMYTCSTYLVGDDASSGVTVSRRYSEFAWLAEQLTTKHSQMVIPVLPGKQAIGRFDPEFIKIRRRRLERFVNRIAEHPALRGDADFQAFLSLPAEDFRVRMNETKASKSLGSSFRSFGRSLAFGLTSEKKKAELQLDPEVGELRKFLATQETHTKTLASALDLYVGKRTEHSHGLSDFSDVLEKYAKSESEQVAESLNAFRSTLDKLAVEEMTLADQEGATIAECIHEYVGLTSAARTALDNHDMQMGGLAAAKAKLADLQKSLAKESAKSSSKKLDKINADITATETKVRNETEFATTIEKASLRELERFNRTRVAEQRDAWVDFAKLQAEHARTCASQWRDLEAKLLSITK